MKRMKQLVYNSNKAMVSYLLKSGFKVRDVKLGNSGTILFGFDPEETADKANEWFQRKVIDKDKVAINK